MTDRCIICYRPLGADSVPCPSCDCGRKVCPNHASRPAGEPTATQLYDLVKERRSERGHRILTIPEIDSVLRARADRMKASVGGPGSDPHTETPTQVLWEGETSADSALGPNRSFLSGRLGAVDCPPGTRVRVVRADTPHHKATQ